MTRDEVIKIIASGLPLPPLNPKVAKQLTELMERLSNGIRS